jgi:riboflavin synthase
MFTGIIEAVSPLVSVRPAGGKTHLTITRPAAFDDIKHGSSIAVNGICLTVIAMDQLTFMVEIMNETIKKTTAAAWKNGEPVNLERALKLGDRLDGHWVQGHVDKTCALLQTQTINQTLYLTFALSSEDKELMVLRGSITINGVSLTISELQANRFSVALIGHTLDYTNLSKLHLGQTVNLEYDILGKYLLRQKTQKAEHSGFHYE